VFDQEIDSKTAGYICAESSLALGELDNVKIEHVQCDPRQKDSLGAAIDISSYSAAIVMQDTLWMQTSQGSPGMPSDDGEAAYALTQADMMRLDAAVLNVQLNIRYLLEQNNAPEINIIAEKLSSTGETRFEDRRRLPLGASINSSSFAAKSLAQEALNPGTIDMYPTVGVRCRVFVQDASSFVSPGEKVTFAVLQERCSMLQQILIGYYFAPNSTRATEQIKLVLNPQGIKERLHPREWNTSDGSCKLITFVTVGLHKGGWMADECRVDMEPPVNQQDEERKRQKDFA